MTDTLGFIFDMDGTLVDNMSYHLLAWQQLLAGMDIHMSFQEIGRRNHGTISEVIRNMLGDQLSEDQVVELGMRKEALYRQLYSPHMRLRTGCDRFLQLTKANGIPSALATMADRVNIDFILDGLGIRDNFSVVIGADQISRGKPDPEVFLTAAQAMHLLPENCIVFEDSPSGLAAAERAGMRVVYLTGTPDQHDLSSIPVILQVARDYLKLDPTKLISV
jgi:beta-phosphoglucomutase